MSELAITFADDAPVLTREQWLEKRRHHVGASDIWKILTEPLGVWLEKTGRSINDGSSRLARRGLALEPFILSEFVLETGKPAVRDGIHVVHPTHPLIACTPDALLTEEDSVLELKAPDQFTYHEWGESWGEVFPERYLAQVAIQMSVKRRSHGYLCGLLGRDLRIFRINRDVGLEEGLIAAGEQFMRDYVIPDRQPPVDATETSWRYIERRFPRPTTKFRPATDEETALVADLASVRSELKRLSSREELAKNRLREAIGDAEGITGTGFKVGYGTQIGSVSWKDVAMEFNPPGELVEKHRGDTTRRLRPSGVLFPRGNKED